MVKGARNRNLRRRRKRLRRMIAFSVVIIIATALLFGTCYVISVLSKFQHEDIDANSIGIDKEKFVDSGTGITNIALFGVDNDGTSDSIMLLSVDKDRNKIKLISILRDSLVKVDPKNKTPYYTKLNEAYNSGGAETSLRAINKNYNLNVTEYASIKFDGMSKIIDKVGGIDINITKDEQNWINGLIASTKELKTLSAGVEDFGNVHLNGAQAVAYSRIRKVSNQDGQSNDYGRTDRQRAVMEQLLHKALSLKRSDYPAFIESVVPYMKTSLSIGQIIDLAGILTRPGLVMEQTRVPMTEYTINADYDYYLNDTKKSTVYYNLTYAGDIINAFIYEDITPQDYMIDHPPILTGGPLDNKNNSSSKEQSSNNTEAFSNSKNSSSSSKKN